MNLGLSGKIAMVTGASSGIGAETARIFAEEGADVILCYSSNLRGAEETARVVQAAGRRSWLCQFDIRLAGEIRQAVTRLPAWVEGIDALVLCAGYNKITPLANIPDHEWEDILNINLNGPFYLLQAVIPLLREGGAVVTVASVAAHTGAPHHAHYAAAKAGLVNLTKSAARALAPRIRVNCVAPGITLTPMGIDTTPVMDPEYARKNLLLQRYAAPDEIARWIVFTASPAAGFMTGATIDVNGGRNLR